ncbi:MAG: carbamoyltransferase C-terminal domain-containing protein [Candidatus Acidiferrales bacterium]
MYILGLSAMEHGPAATIIGDNGVIAAIEEAKLARARSVGGIPRLAIKFCLDRVGIKWQDVDRIAIASRPARAWFRKAIFRAKLAPLAPISSVYFLNKASGELGRELNNFRIVREMAGGRRDRVQGLDHHLCHAASAYFGSPFDRALIVTMDERGDGRCGFAGRGKGGQIHELAGIAFPHSLAWVYTQVTKLIGFRPHGDEHKTQWLSATGDPIFADLFARMLQRSPQSPPHLNSKYFQRDFAGDLSFSDEFYRSLGVAREMQPHLDDKLRANIAASLQQACTGIAVEWLETLRKQTGERALCLAGGLFLNSLLVAAVEEKAGFENIFVQPAAGNEGAALGAAWLAWHQSPEAARVSPLTSLYLGPSYSNEQVKQVLDNCKATYHWCNSEDQKIDEALRLLQAGKIVAWFQGAAEFGPRALGNRSLLASPWAPYVTDNLNDFVKHREPYRPFALSIPQEDCRDYFECTTNGRFMTTMASPTAKMRKLLESTPSGFVAQDSVRLHVVARDDNPLFWKLLKRAGEKGSAPILVNASFNLFGEPLVITPRDAVRSYFCSGVDALMAGSFLLSKR